MSSFDSEISLGISDCAGKTTGCVIQRWWCGESWFNQTGNLRSSVGYVVVAHGRIVKSSDFGTVLHGSEGSRAGKALAEERAKKYSNGYALIVVAGMNYAELVEARDNKSVLASAELLAHAEFYNVMEKLRNQVAK